MNDNKSDTKITVQSKKIRRRGLNLPLTKANPPMPVVKEPQKEDEDKKISQLEASITD